ncbi:MAG: TIM-barrel domain-containing protein [Cellulosilyticaceae bacterium]
MYQINENIKRFSYGNPFETEIIINKGNKKEIGSLPYFKELGEGFVYTLAKKDKIYGLGENVRGINKRGWIYESFCSDDYTHTSTKRSLYAAHNFFIVAGEETFGVFVDYPGKVTFDMGYSDKDTLTIKTEKKDVDLYIIEGTNVYEIVKHFRKLIGKSYVPPKWAFGYQQSRWSYWTKEDVREVYNNFKTNEIPLDCIYLDIDYMEDYKDFTVNEKAFSGFQEFVKELKAEGVRLIPIIDAGVKIQEGYDVYEEGVKKGYFCTDEQGKPFVAAVWPGKVHFPDFLNKEARAWFGKKYQFLTDMGIEGFWNDMNEPAIFYTEKGLKDALQKAKDSEGKNLDINTFFDLKDTFVGMSNKIEDYKSFYHNVEGKRVNHYDVHNMYGYNMTKAAAEGFDAIDSNKRFLMFSRASSIGMHRFGGIWTGDNISWWEHLLLNIKMMPSLNMCGFLYCGADVGGFGDNATEELLHRWNAFAVFTPLFRNHACNGTRRQEPYMFSEDGKKIAKNMIGLRYAMIPYLYSEFMKAATEDDLYFKPLAFEYQDAFCDRIEDQLLLGDSVMLTPVYESNAEGRYVYLPETMLAIHATSYETMTMNIMPQGHHYIDVALEEIPFFLRQNKMLVTVETKNCVDKLDTTTLNVLAFVKDVASYVYYDDDGITKDYLEADKNTLTITITRVNGQYEVIADKQGVLPVENLNITIIDTEGNKATQTMTIA